ncbi:c-type cytochrome [Pseudocolwellia agarivorans]|uniref:c-type cytochrome n=1 Tax=Pseudocolwellia agarivorans TaxID=1911682 RepID=UPI000984DF05|nr:c-type cytochrome [Pseudocolwellia agarivorans]
MKRFIFSLLIIFTGMNVAAAASGDAEAGKGKVALCAGCHGANGISASDAYPNLAGQHADYIVKQLKALKNSTDRSDPVMGPMAAGLSEQDMADIGAYYNSLPRTAADAGAAGGDTGASAAAPVAKYEPDAVAGKSLYELGDASRSIGACIGCHGKDGNSEVLIYPNLAKQHPEYIQKQLHNFKANENRSNYPMNQFAGQMTDEEILDIGAYFADTKAVANIKPKKVTVAAITEEVLAGEKKAAVCAACHGTGGNATVAIYPKLAGQHASYIVKQLKELKNGDRKDPVMSGMAAPLSEQDMVELAAYFSAQKPLAGNGKGSELGSKIYYGGKVNHVNQSVTACVACHGATGKGMANAGFPSLANQSVEYITSQLTKFKSGERANDKSKMMRNIAMSLSEKDIDELAQFIATLK